MIRYLLVIIIILAIIEYLWFYWYKKNYKVVSGTQERVDNIEGELKHVNKVKQFFKDKMNERLAMLDKMDLEEWIKYSNKNTLIEYDGIKYYIFGYEIFGENNEKNLYKFTPQKEFLNLTFETMRDITINKYEILELFPPYKNLPNEMFAMPLNDDGFNEMSYFWENPINKTPVRKNTLFTHWKKGNFKGVMGVGYTTEDLISRYEDIYYNYLDSSFIILMNIVILSVPLILCMIDFRFSMFIKSTFVLLASWLFLIYFLSQTSTISTLKIENEKLNQVSSAILGASFFTGIGIFLVGVLDTSKKLFKNNFNNVKILQKLIFLFVIVVSLLLLSLLKMSSYKSVDELRDQRIYMQLFFNYSIFYNIVICILFILFVFENYNLIDENFYTNHYAKKYFLNFIELLTKK